MNEVTISTRVQSWLDPWRRPQWTRLTRFFFLRGMGFIYFVAFFSLWQQLLPLLGAHGLLPVPWFLDNVGSGSAWTDFARLPSLFWFNASDVFMRGLCGLGVVLSLLVLAGYANALIMAALWFIYMSFVHVGQTWYSFGWEIQLLEAGFLSIFLCPFVDGWPASARAAPSAVFWLLRWLLFRVMFGAGLIKIRGDTCWRDLSCLQYHYETQPVPNPLSWLAHQAPPWFHTTGVLFNHFVELVVPWFFFAPRRWRRAAGLVTIFFQGCLILSGNLSFLNWLTAIIAIACLDDGFLIGLVPKRWRRVLLRARGPVTPARTVLTIALCLLVAVLSINPVSNLISRRQVMNTSFDRFDLVNTYGAFGSIERERREIVLEGTDDDPASPTATWHEYAFKCKPGALDRRPCIISPYHYRLDWLMWFAAMPNRVHPTESTAADYPWLIHLVYKLLANDSGALSLLDGNPFPEHPPRAIRGAWYQYHFTRLGQSGWWTRSYIAPYLPPLSRGSPGLRRFIDGMGFSD